MERRRGLTTRRRVTVVIFLGVLALVLVAVAGCGEQMARMEENQIKLQAMVAANARELTTLSDQLHAGQGKINESIQTLDGNTRKVGAEVVAVQAEQRRLQETVAAGHAGIHQGIAKVQESQGSLHERIAHVSEVARHTATDLTALARDHAALSRTVQANQQELTGGLAAVTGNQQRIQTGIGALRQASAELARDAGTRYDSLQTTLQDNNRQLTERLVTLASGHERLVADIVNVHTLLGTMAADFTTAHASLGEQLGTNHQMVTQQIAGLSTRQQQLQAGVDTLGGKADRAATQLADTGASLQETLRVSREVLTGQMAASLQNQQALHGDVRTLSDKADKLTSDIGDVATEQTALHATLRTNHEVATGNFTTVSEAQTRLQASVGRLDSKADAMAATQGDLQQTLQRQHQNTKAGIAELANGQQTLRGQLDTLTATTGQTALDVIALSDSQAVLQQSVRAAEENRSEQANRTMAGLNHVAEQQAAMQQSIDAGHTALAARATQLADNQQALRSGIEALGQTTQQAAAELGTRTDRLAAELASAVAAGQNMLNDTLTRQGQTFETRMTELAGGQQQIQNNLDTLTATTGQTALDLLALSNDQAELTQTVKTGVAEIGARTDKVAAELMTAAAAGQDSLSDTLNRQGQAVSAQMAQIADSQQQAQSKLDTLTATTGQVSLDILALSNGQAGLTQTVKTGVAEIGARTDKVSADLTAAMAAGQNTLNDTLTRQGQNFETRMTELAGGQQQMQNNLDTLTAMTGQTALDLLALSNGQTQLAQTVQTGAVELGSRTDKVAAELTAVAAGQNTLRETLDRQGQALAARVTELAGGQQQMQNGLDTLTATTGQAALDLLGVTARQEATQAAVQNQGNALSTQVAQIADGQQQIRNDLDTLTATTGQTALDLLALSNGQAGLTQAVKAGAAELGTRTDKVAAELTAVAAGQNTLRETLDQQGQTLAARMTELAGGQQQIRDDLDTLTATASQTGLDVLAVTARQEAIQATVQSQGNTLSVQMTKVADGQQQVLHGLDTLTATAGQTGLDVLGVTARQEAIQAAVQGQGSALRTQMTQVADGQQQVLHGLDTLTATAGQTGLDVLAVTARQEAIQAAVQSQGQALSGQMAKLADGQQQMQDGLDVVTATAGQTALDALALTDHQVQLGQAVQVVRREMIDKLATLAQGQQSWTERLDAAQTKVGTIADSLATLEQQIARFQGILQVSLQDTTAVLGATGQQRQQFEVRVSEDMQAVIQSLGQLRQTQATLQEQLTHLQQSTQGQADSLRSVLEQVKNTSETNTRVREPVPQIEDRAGVGATRASPVPPTEVRISDAKRPQVPEVPLATE